MSILLSTASGNGFGSFNAYLFLTEIRSEQIDQCRLLIPDYFSKDTEEKISEIFIKHGIPFKIHSLLSDQPLKQINDFFNNFTEFRDQDIFIDVTTGDRKIAYSLIVSAQFYKKNIKDIFFIHIPEAKNRTIMITELKDGDYSFCKVPMLEDLDHLTGEVQIVNSSKIHEIRDPDLLRNMLEHVGEKALRGYLFRCPYCDIRSPRLNLNWSSRTECFNLICPNPKCTGTIKGLRKGYTFPILLNYAVLDTCVLVSGAALQIVREGYLDGYCILIPLIVQNEIEYLEKEHQRNKKKKAKIASNQLIEIRRIEATEQFRKMSLNFEFGDPLKREDYELLKHDRGLMDRKISDIAKQCGGLLITSDLGFSNRASARGINVIYVKFPDRN